MIPGIQLPGMRRRDENSPHPFPLQIGLQTKRLIQGSVFYYLFSDLVIGQYFKDVQHPYERIRRIFIEGGGSEEDWELGWKCCFEENLQYLPNPIFQNVLYSLSIHWDWYISNLGKFIRFSRKYDNTPTISNNIEKSLEKIGLNDISHQIEILEKTTGIRLSIEEPDLNALREMNLVRNLSVHNEWEVDDFYLDKTKNQSSWKIGDIRVFSPSELLTWQKALLEIISKSSTTISNRYSSIRDVKYEELRVCD